MALALTWLAHPADDQIADVLALLAAAEAADGVHAISEAAMLRLGGHSTSRTGVHLLAHDAAGPLVGYAGLDERSDRPSAEFAVHPEHRRRGIGAALLAALLDRVHGPLWVWAHGEHPAALRLVRRAGLVSQRELMQMRRALPDPIPSRPLPAGVVLRAFVPGQDEAAVVRVNNRAFAWHPEQSRLDTRELMVLETQPWFDPKGFLLAVDPTGQLLGFHWTKVHPDGLGEVYVLAVDPDAQGTGLGSALTMAGLAHLRERGAPEAMLYVDSDNAAAVRTYQKLGFTHHHTDVEFLLDPDPAPAEAIAKVG
ncbi:MAG: mycothiol synthase [Pseudonocardiaceae bacterium]